MSESVKEIMNKVVFSQRNIKIKLLGDSITHGVGGTGFKQDGEEIVQGFARNKDGYCWAKMFKEYMKKQFGCTVVNNACSGTRIEFIIDNFKKLVDEDDDIIICTIGTNNRHQYFEETPKKTREEFMENFYNNILKLHSMFEETKKDVIFVANIPASAENEKDGENYWRLLHMNDINDLYLKASEVCGFPIISMYSRFLEYCKKNEISVDSLLADGLHPNDKGYDVIFSLMLDELGV